MPDDKPHGIQSTISLFVNQEKPVSSERDSTASSGDLIPASDDLLSAPGSSGVNPLSFAAGDDDGGDDVKMPMIPLKKFQQKESIVVNTRDQDEMPLWYVVLSPRETRGATGPFTVAELREKFAAEEIHDRTLTWKQGIAKWHELKHLPYLYPKVVRPPAVPTRVYQAHIASIEELEQEIDRDVVKKDRILGVLRFPVLSLAHICVKCGAFATCYTPSYGEQPVPPSLAEPVNLDLPPQTVTEVIAGFLWVGNVGSSRGNNIDQLEVTMIVNCTEDLKTAPSRPPQYRCHRAPMKECTKRSNVADFDHEDILKTFTSVCDAMDWERSHTAKVPDSDYIVRSVHDTRIKYTGPVDKKGRPKVPYVPVAKPIVIGSSNRSERPPATDADDDESAKESKKEVDPDIIIEPVKARGGPAAPPRVLLYSRLGLDRPCAIAVAYYVRTWKVRLQTALAEVKKGRYAMKISEPYMLALETWERRYAVGVGESYCDDCVEQARERAEMDADAASLVTAASSAGGRGFAPVDVGADAEQVASPPMSPSPSSPPGKGPRSFGVSWGDVGEPSALTPTSSAPSVGSPSSASFFSPHSASGKVRRVVDLPRHSRPWSRSISPSRPPPYLSMCPSSR